MKVSVDIRYIEAINKTSVLVYDNDFRIGKMVEPQDAYYILGALLDEFNKSKELVERVPLVAKGSLLNEDDTKG